MSRFDDLINEFCPDGVEFRPLADLLDYEQPSRYLVKSTAYDASGPTPVLTAGRTFILGYTEEAGGIYPASPNEPVVIFDDFTTAFKWVDFPFKAKSSAMKMLTTKPAKTVSLRYAYYAMQTIRYAPQDHARQWIGKYSQFSIPVPPVEVQDEIIRVLNLFTSLDAELKAEQESRRKQYTHYLDQLLTLRREDVEWTTLGEVGEFIRGRRFTKDDYVESGLGCIHYGQIYTDYGTSATSTVTFLDPERKASRRLARNGDLVIAATGENVDDVCKAVAWLGDDDIAVHDDCQIFRHTLNPKYAAYFFQSTSFNQQKVKFASESKVVRVSGDNLAKIMLQVPPIEVQARIVAALDSFESLMSDRAIGLPAEINARQAQYAHYRDHLLTFKELAV
jgi:type I restriction enzyme S subunit